MTSPGLMPNGTTSHRHRWLVTGVAGFIGSHLLEVLLRHDQDVVGLDNFSTGRRLNLEEVQRQVTAPQWERFRLIEGDITRPEDIRRGVLGTDFVLHEAALGSVPKSMECPVETHAANVTGFIHVLEESRKAGVRRVVYASSSAVYGDCADVPAREERIGNPLSPYALSKLMNEQYAAVFARCYGFESIGLRYFNVFGPRQDPNGPYAAVIPRWIDALLGDRPVEIFGDGETSRDFCHVDNIVHANLVAATAPFAADAPRVFNVGLGDATSLNRLFEFLRDNTARLRPEIQAARPIHRDFRDGDVRHSCADISRIRKALGYEAVKDVPVGLAETVQWFARGR